MSGKGKTLRKNITYNTETHKDIAEWLDNLPPKSHSDYIRRAIKHYIEHEKNKGNTEQQEELIKRVEKLEKIVAAMLKKELNEDTMSELDIQSKEENNSEDYIDANNILKNLGK